MKFVLEELYYGNIRPFANRREVSECEIFIDGFQLGMRLALELLEM